MAQWLLCKCQKLTLVLEVSIFWSLKRVLKGEVVSIRPCLYSMFVFHAVERDLHIQSINSLVHTHVNVYYFWGKPQRHGAGVQWDSVSLGVSNRAAQTMQEKSDADRTEALKRESQEQDWLPGQRGETELQCLADFISPLYLGYWLEIRCEI